MKSYAEAQGFQNIDWLKILKAAARPFAVHEIVGKGMSLHVIRTFYQDNVNGPTGVLPECLNRKNNGEVENSVLSLIASELRELIDESEFKKAADKFEELTQYVNMAIDDEEDDRDDIWEQKREEEYEDAYNKRYGNSPYM